MWFDFLGARLLCTLNRLATGCTLHIPVVGVRLNDIYSLISEDFLIVYTNEIEELCPERTSTSGGVEIYMVGFQTKFGDYIYGPERDGT